MPKYLCLQRSLPNNAADGPTPEQMQEMYAEFGAWQQKFKDKLTDMGGKLGAGRFVNAEGISLDSFIKVHELAGGYMIVTAENMDDAVQVARECPGLAGPGSACEVIEIHSP